MDLLAYAAYVVAAGRLLAPLRRWAALRAWLVPGRRACALAGASWVVAVLLLYRAVLGSSASPHLAARIAPGGLALAIPLRMSGVDTLAYGTQIVIGGVVLDVALYALVCYVLCRAVARFRPRAKG